MQIVIDISEEDYEMLVYTKNTRIFDLSKSDRIILDGTSLLKGHGRLIDADELKTKYGGWYNLCNDKSIRAVETKEIDWMPTIIEADKE